MKHQAMQTNILPFTQEGQDV